MTVFSIFTLLGGLAFFIYGMNQMSHSLEKIAGARMRNVIDKMTKNRIVGLIMGCFITIAMQSSSAVTVMLVGRDHGYKQYRCSYHGIKHRNDDHGMDNEFDRNIER